MLPELIELQLWMLPSNVLSELLTIRIGKKATLRLILFGSKKIVESSLETMFYTQTKVLK